VSALSAVGDQVRVESVSGHGNLVFAVPNRLFLAATAASLLVALGLVLWLLRQLRVVFQSLRAGHPFVAANAARIRHMAYVMFAAEGARAGAEFLWNRYAAAHFAVAGWQFDVRPDVHLTPLLGGLVVLALAEVFRAGTRLDEDQSLTV
jgi:hypothetical protein